MALQQYKLHFIPITYKKKDTAYVNNICQIETSVSSF